MAKRRYSLNQGINETPTPLDCKVGDIVCFSAAFLRNTGQITGESGSLRGPVLELVNLDGEGQPTRFARVHWKGYKEPTLVNLCNLAHPGANRRACAS